MNAAVGPADSDELTVDDVLDFVRVAEEPADLRVRHALADEPDRLFLAQGDDLAGLADDALLLGLPDGSGGSEERPGEVIDELGDGRPLFVDPPTQRREDGQGQDPTDCPSPAAYGRNSIVACRQRDERGSGAAALITRVRALRGAGSRAAEAPRASRDTGGVAPD